MMVPLLVILFAGTYALIVLENSIRINKAAVALVGGVASWTAVMVLSSDKHEVGISLFENIGSISGILFFLIGAITIVELIDSHEGFTIVSNLFSTLNKRYLLWLVALVTFFLSALLDNLTTTIIMITMLMKIIPDRRDIKIFASIIVIAANAGGVWSPIGDVTSTMLWLGGRITSHGVISNLFIPSLFSILVPLCIFSIKFKGAYPGRASPIVQTKNIVTSFHRTIVFFTGVTVLVLIPVFKAATGLPPYMGMLLGLGIVWIVIELIHKNDSQQTKIEHSVVHALRSIDMPTILFFLGILLCVSALQSANVLHLVAQFLGKSLKYNTCILLSIGLISSIVDNVPLTAAVMGMYPLTQYSIDHQFWILLTYCVGTGGSILIIGSAAGIAAMGITKIDFVWYTKKIAPLVLAGYFTGAGIYVIIQALW